MISQATLRAAGRRTHVPAGHVLYVGNVPTDATIAEIARHFGNDRVDGVRLAYDVDGRRRGFVFITFAYPDDAASALAERDGSVLGGRILTVRPAT